MSKRPTKAPVLPFRLTDDEREFVFETLRGCRRKQRLKR